MRQIILMLLVFCLASCRKAKEVVYETDALDCVENILNSGKNNPQTLELLRSSSEKYKFAADLEEKMSDRQSIKHAENLVNSGKLTKAKRSLEERVVMRGYSQELNKSLDLLDTAIQISEFSDKRNDLEINEAVREFYRIQIKSKAVFGENSNLDKWLQNQKSILKTKAIKDKADILRSMKFTADYASLYQPEIFEILMLQVAIEERRDTLPGVEDSLDKKISGAVNSFGVTKLMENFYSYRRTYTPANLLDKLSIAKTAAKQGNTSLTLSTLKELQKIAPLATDVRRKIIKSLFLAKGWNDSSLINRDFMDISFILETVYKANEE